ncbi:hypothetical protein C8255_12995 [filamentous cyanobacterium CCP3]|nr:hypothetical protein C8255_12995 [filamentous cyanobacterium CCP3]
MTPRELQDQLVQLPISDRWSLVQTLLTSIQQDTAAAAVADQTPQPKPPHDPALANLHPWTQNLLGILQTTEDDSQDTYIDYLEAKYS